MKPEAGARYFTAAQLAVVLNVSRKRAHQHMAIAERHARTMIVRGVPARCWPVSALPASVAATLAEMASRQGYCSVADLLTSPPKPWNPELPLSRLAPAAVQKAELRRDVLAPILGGADGQMVTVAVLVRRAIQAFSDLGCEEKTGSERSIRLWIEAAIERDRALWNWQRTEIYLDANPQIKAARGLEKVALSEAGGDELAAALERVKNLAEPTEHESTVVWDATFRRFVFLVESEVPEGKAKRALLRILGRNDAAFVGATANARSKAWQRRFQKWSSGGCTADALTDGRLDNARPEVFTLTPEERSALRLFRLEKGSVNLAVRWFQKSRACRTETRLLIEKALDDAARRRRAVNWPLSLRRAAHVTVEEHAKFRGEKKYQELETVSHRGMWFPGADGEKVPLRPNTVWESDDMSSNEPFCFLDAETGKAMPGRQTLCTQDVFSAAFLSVMPVGRSRDAYRVEDIADHLLETVRANGLPDVWRLERGVWENNLIDGIPLRDGTRWGGLGHLFHVERTFTSRGKGTIESSFNLLQAYLGHESLTIGRKRGEFEKGTKTLVKARNGDETAVGKFWSIGEYANASRDAMREFNATPKKRRAYGRDVVSPDDLYRDVVRKECPEDQLWRFCPIKRELTVRRGNVECSVEHYPFPFCFRVNGNEGGIYLENGYPVLIAFHPGHPERGCFIFNAERGARNRDGWKFGELLVVAPLVDDLPQFGLSPQDREMRARKRANAAVHQEFRNIVGSNARVSVARNSHGRSVRLEDGTGVPLVPSTDKSIKEQRAELRSKQAEDYEKKAAAESAMWAQKLKDLPAKRIAAKRRLGIFDAEVILAMREEERKAQEALGIFAPEVESQARQELLP